MSRIIYTKKAKINLTNSNLSMRMLSTFSLISYPVGVRNLIKERQKYLFRSLYTTQKDTQQGVLLCVWSKISNVFVGATSGRPRAFTERPYEAARAIRESPLRMWGCSSEFAGGTPPLRMEANPRRRVSFLPVNLCRLAYTVDRTACLAVGLSNATKENRHGNLYQ